MQSATSIVNVFPIRRRIEIGCPKAASAKQFGIAKTFRNYRADLSYSAESCCVPDTDCAECRHYAAGSAIVTASLAHHVKSARLFRGWLDYVDTYLAIWILGYQKGRDLYAF